MRLLTLFKKSLLENIRDWKIIILTLTFAPFFVVLMYFYFTGTSNTFEITIINREQSPVIGETGRMPASQGLIDLLKTLKNPDGRNTFHISLETDIEKAREKLKDKSIDLVVEIPADFSMALQDYREAPGTKKPPATVKTWGNAANPRYILAAVFSDMITYQYAETVIGQSGPLAFQAETLGSLQSLDDFSLYVPALLGLALMMLMFTAAASLIKEKDKGTIIRLRLSKMTASEFFTSISLTQVIIGLFALALTFLTAIVLGYRTTGSLLAVTVVGIVASLAIMAISLVVAGFLRTIFDLMTVGCFPFFILMFFSGGMFPLPSVKLFSLGERIVNINDILPTTHSITAFNKILNFGAGLNDVAYEMAAMLILTIIYFFIGLPLFRRRHLRAR